jgi:hypothetical protein
LAKLVLIELDFYKHLFFTPSISTSLATNVYHDWVVHMAWDGCREWKGWWVSDEGKIDVITKRSAAFKRKVARFATAAALTGSLMATGLPATCTSRPWLCWSMMGLSLSGFDDATCADAIALRRLSGDLSAGVTAIGMTSCELDL